MKILTFISKFMIVWIITKSKVESFRWNLLLREIRMAKFKHILTNCGELAFSSQLIFRIFEIAIFVNICKNKHMSILL